MVSFLIPSRIMLHTTQEMRAMFVYPPKKLCFIRHGVNIDMAVNCVNCNPCFCINGMTTLNKCQQCMVAIGPAKARQSGVHNSFCDPHGNYMHTCRACKIDINREAGRCEHGMPFNYSCWVCRAARFPGAVGSSRAKAVVLEETPMDWPGKAAREAREQR